MSLTILKNQTNKLSVTLSERILVTGSTILLQLISNDTREEKVVKMTGDTSSNPIRINQYMLGETTLANEDLTNSTINLLPGTYDYAFYSTFSSGLIIDSRATLVETGLAKVVGDAPVEYNAFNGGKQTIIFK